MKLKTLDAAIEVCALSPTCTVLIQSSKTGLTSFCSGYYDIPDSNTGELPRISANFYAYLYFT